MSLSKSEQARINGAKSKGPTTPDGKARSAMNALKHGRYAKSATTIDIEDDIAFSELLDAYNAQFAPQSIIEARVVNEIAHIDWTLTRWRAIETAQINRAYDIRNPIYTGVENVPDRVQILAVALEAAVNVSRFPYYINARITRLLSERNSALRTLASIRRANPNIALQPLFLPSDNNILPPAKDPISTAQHDD